MTMKEILERAKTLSIAERKTLIKELVDTLEDTSGNAQKLKSLLDYRGVGSHLADDTDPQAHLNALRDEWDQ